MFDGSMKQEATFKVTEIYENEKPKELGFQPIKSCFLLELIIQREDNSCDK